MAELVRDYRIKQKTSIGGDTLILHPETKGHLVIQETDYRLLGPSSFTLGSTYTDGTLNSGTGIGELTWTALIEQGIQSGNITLTLPSEGGELALKSDVPNLSFTDGLLDGTFDTGTGAISLVPYAAAADGTFSWTALPTTGITDLSYSGNFHTNLLSATGDLSVGGNSTTTGSSTISGVLEANGGITADGNKFTVQDGTGNMYTAGSLTATQLATLNGGADINGDLTVDGGTISLDALVAANFTLSGANASATNLILTASNSIGDASVLISGKTEIDITAPIVDINGAVDISSTLGVTGISTLVGKLNANGGIAVDTNKFTVDTSGNTVIAGTLGVTGATTLTDDLAINGGDLTTTSATFNILDTTATTINAFGDATTLSVGYDGTASSTTEIATGVTGDGNTTTVNVGTTGASGSTTTINLGTAGLDRVSTVNINGDLNVSGTMNVVNTETINIADNIVILNSNLDDYNGIDLIPGGWTAGLTVKTGAATQQNLFWDADDNRWEIDGQEIASSASKLSLFSATSSAELAGVISDETGTGKLVFSDAPTLSSFTATSLANLDGGIEVYDATNGNVFTVASSTGDIYTAGNYTTDGKMIITSPTTKTLGSNENNLFEVLSSISEPLLTVATNGDVTIGGILTLNGTTNVMIGDFDIDGDVDISGSLFVQGDATFTGEIIGDNMILTGSLITKGDVWLGNQELDTIQIDGLTSFTDDIHLLENRYFVNETVDVGLLATLKVYKEGWESSTVPILDAIPADHYLIKKQDQFVYYTDPNYTLYTAVANETWAGAQTETVPHGTTDPLVNITLDSDTGDATFAGTVSIVGALTANSFNGLTIDSSTGTLDIANTKSLTVDDTTTLGTNAITLASGKSLTAQYASLSIGDATGTGNITLKSNNNTDKTLILEDNLTSKALTSGHVLYASSNDTIDSEAQLAISRGGTGAATAAANTVFAAPNGSTGAPAFRSLVNTDLPNTGVTPATYSSVTVNSKGVVTTAGQLVQVGYYLSTGTSTDVTNQPAANLAVGGLFFEALEATPV